MCVCVLVVGVAVFVSVIVHLYLYLHLPGLPCPYPLGPSTAWSALSCITAAHKWSSTPVIIPLTAWLTLYLYLYLRFCIYIWHHHRPQVIIHPGWSSTSDHPPKSFQLLSSSCNPCNLVLSCFVNVRRFLQTWLNCVCDVMQGQQQKNSIWDYWDFSICFQLHLNFSFIRLLPILQNGGVAVWRKVRRLSDLQVAPSLVAPPTFLSVRHGNISHSLIFWRK